MKLKSNPGLKGRRRGNASLELALFLPFWAFFLMMIFSTAVVNLSHLNVEMDSRYKAWKFRHTPWFAEEHEPISGSVSGSDLNIVRDGLRSSATTAVKEKLATEMLQIPGGLTRGEAEAHHFVVSGVWDHREIEFSRDHSRLSMTPKVNYFSGQLPRNLFRVLGGW